MPSVSILMPSYNHARFLPDGLRSVQAQSFEDWELVIVDDGSKDESVEVARGFSSSDSRIRVYTNEQNLGTYGTEQRALTLSSGRLIAVMNSDDLWHRDKLRLQVEQLDSDPRLSLSYVLGWMIDDQGNELEGEDVHQDWPREEVQAPLPYLLYENRILASGVLFRRDTLRFETTCRYSGDWVALLEQSQKGPVGCVPQRLNFWRQHENNTYVRSVGQMVEEIRVRRAILKNPERWFLDRLPRQKVEEGLAKNAMNLFALYVYFREPAMARQAGKVAIKYHTDKKSAIKRTLSSFLPAEYIFNYFWRGADRGSMAVEVDAVRARLKDLPDLEIR